MKKRGKLLFLALLLVLIGFYFLLLNRFKNNICSIIDELPYGYKDYYSEEFINNIEDYKGKENTFNLFYVFNKSNTLKKSLNDNSCYKSNGLTPSIYIYTYENGGLKLTKAKGYKECQIVYIDEFGNSIIDYEGNVKVRGNSTSALDKKPYTLKFSEKQNLIDAGKAKKWNLLADAYDSTFLRNNTFLTLAEKMELDYTPEHHYVEVYMDQIYLGCYLLTEAVEVGKERVDIDVDNKDFFLEFESYRVEDGVYYFETDHGIRLALKEPEEPTGEQLKYYEVTIDELDKVLFSNDYEDLCKHLDIDSFVKLYIINEYAKTVDFINSSVNFYYKDGKMYAGPVWDFDLSSGNSDTFKKSSYWQTINNEKVAYTDYYCREGNPIFKQLFEYDEVKEIYESYFNEYKDELKSIYEPNGFIDETINAYGPIFDRNFASKEEGGAGWDISALQDTLQTQPFDTYEKNVEFLREFLTKRFEWLSSNK